MMVYTGTKKNTDKIHNRSISKSAIKFIFFEYFLMLEKSEIY